MIDIETARKYLDFSARIGPGQRANEQLEGAVALHNLLDEHGVAYLADEVGMGKTYVALGAIALFRHFDPHFRVLVLAPSENIQKKWMKELANFVRHNVCFPDMRVKGLDHQPARPRIKCDSLIDLVRETSIDAERDFFARLTSFSLPLTDERDGWNRVRDRFKKLLPWMDDEVFRLNSKAAFKDNFARATCCALPEFDLVIVDEAHNLKHGFAPNVASRNRMLGLAFGHPSEQPDPALFPHYGPRAKRVLFLSATPIEERYTQLWNQLDVFGLGEPFEALRRDDLDEEEKKRIAGQFLIRRVTAINVAGEEYTKNLYRREWRRGGVASHDEPIRVEDDRQRLLVALVQKKVSELLGSERFGNRFQIGMLASFESFLETAKVKRGPDEAATFDDTLQTDDIAEREGIDVNDINRLSRDYRARFEQEMPHPKMDALVDQLAEAWTTGRKALVFVRRVASVKELKRKLDERYDAWLLDRLRHELPEAVRPRLESAITTFKQEKARALATDMEQAEGDKDDKGGRDTFFAWYFRGAGPSDIVSGATVQKRFTQATSSFATFFEDNYVMALLGAAPGDVEDQLATTLGLTREALRAELKQRSARFLSRDGVHPRGARFEALQAAAIELLMALPGELGEEAHVIWHERFKFAEKLPHADVAPDPGDYLEIPTFWTELRRRPELRARLWPEADERNRRLAFRAREQRAQLLAAAARLGHAFIDLYVLTIQRLGSLEPRAQEAREEGRGADLDRITSYLDLLEAQAAARFAAPESPWRAFDELAAIADHFELILDTNAHEAREQELAKVAATFGTLLGKQQPNGGMAGQINQTLIRQFRMPGYPFVLVSTDLLQEGEDLHTFCSQVYHYGISWTPSGMEQRIGRIDRVRSQTDRRLSRLSEPPRDGEGMLEVYYPHLEDTVEVLQVQRVLERMNVFLRLMHEGLSMPTNGERKLDVGREIVAGRRAVESIRTRLKTAFPVRPDMLRGEAQALAVPPDWFDETLSRFERLRTLSADDLAIEWEEGPAAPVGMLLGTVKFPQRRQPFSLMLRSVGGRMAVRCVSPVGCVLRDYDPLTIARNAAGQSMRIGAIETRQERTYDLTVEDDVLLAAEAHDMARVSALLRRVTSQADHLEKTQLQGRDQPLSTFQEELIAEVSS